MRTRSSLPVLLCCMAVAAAVAGCKRAERRETAANTNMPGTSTMAPAGSTAAAGTTATRAARPAGAPLRLTDLAGTWRMRSVPEGVRDTTVTRYTIVATRDPSRWMLDFPGRKSIRLKTVTVSGDSLVTESTPYESVRRRGVQVWTRTVLHRQGDSLVGTTTAHYTTKGADSVLTLRTGGVREK